MSYTDTDVEKLIINRLSVERYRELIEEGSINPNELYITTDGEADYSMLEAIYPINSTYMTFDNLCPLSSLFGTWNQSGTIMTSTSLTINVFKRIA